MEPVKQKAETGFAVVELFTSEGCSSCPPADALLAMLRDEYPGQLYALSFHVDYWNRLGWRDPFSDAAFTQRQYAYGKQFGLETVYTPQAVVNGAVQMVGSNEKVLRTVIALELKKARATALALEAHAESGKVLVTCEALPASGEKLYMALVQPEASIEVKRGENGGRKLRHVNVVRAFTTGTGKSSTSLSIPANANIAGWKVIAFIQTGDGRIRAAGQAAIR